MRNNFRSSRTASSRNIKSIAHRKDIIVAQLKEESWNHLHNLSLKTTGRGGKGHGVHSSSLHNWNRKGRW